MWSSNVSNDFTVIYQWFSGSFSLPMTLDLPTFEFHVQTIANQLQLEASTGIDAFKKGIVWFLYKYYFSASRKRKERISNIFLLTLSPSEHKKVSQHNTFYNLWFAASRILIRYSFVIKTNFIGFYYLDDITSWKRKYVFLHVLILLYVENVSMFCLRVLKKYSKNIR